jgi:hypothetical protein
VRCRSLGCENRATDGEFCLPCSFQARTDPAHEALRLEVDDVGPETRKLLGDLRSVLFRLRLVTEAQARTAQAIVDALSEVA